MIWKHGKFLKILFIPGKVLNTIVVFFVSYHKEHGSACLMTYRLCLEIYSVTFQVMLPVTSSQYQAIWLQPNCFKWAIEIPQETQTSVIILHLETAVWQLDYRACSTFLFHHISRWIAKHKLRKSLSYFEAPSKRMGISKISWGRRTYMNKVNDVSVTQSKC